MRSIVAASLISLVASTATPPAQNPDFSGRWIAISPGYNGREMRITQARGTLKMTHTLERATETVTYNLDGTPRREPSDPTEERWSSAAWKNGMLLLTRTRLTRASESRTEYSLSFDSSRRLILGMSNMRLDANRGPAAAPPPAQRKTVIVLKKR